MKLLILSDTHIPGRARALPAPVYRALEEADAVLHAGDISASEVLDALAVFAPVHAVAGNVDPPDLRERLPRRRLLEIAGYRIGLIHGDGPDRAGTPERALAAFPEVDAVVFGHTHKPLNERRGATLLFNPGSPTDRRREPRYSFGWLHLGRGPHEPIVAEHVFFGGGETAEARPYSNP